MNLKVFKNGPGASLSQPIRPCGLSPSMDPHGPSHWARLARPNNEWAGPTWSYRKS